MSSDDRQVEGYEDARIIRSMIEHENSLRNYRITWLVTLQGLLFTALGFAWSKSDTRWLIALFCLLGSAAAIVSWVELKLSSKGPRELLAWWDAHQPENYAGPPVIGHRSSSKGLVRLFRPGRSLPWLFVAGWVCVLVYDFAHTNPDSRKQVARPAESTTAGPPQHER